MCLIFIFTLQINVNCHLQQHSHLKLWFSFLFSFAIFHFFQCYFVLIYLNNELNCHVLFFRRFFCSNIKETSPFFVTVFGYSCVVIQSLVRFLHIPENLPKSFLEIYKFEIFWEFYRSIFKIPIQNVVYRICCSIYYANLTFDSFVSLFTVSKCQHSCK